jgi:hypothetical protein
MELESQAMLIRYRHAECPVELGVEWYDLWFCACNGKCPACGTKDIEPVEWQDAASCFTA